MAFRASSVLLETLGRLTPTGLRGIKVPPPGSKERFHPRIRDIVNLDEYTLELQRIKRSRGFLGVAFFCSEESKACRELQDVIYKIVKMNHHVIFLRLDVKQQAVQEIMENIDVPVLPTFYFYKAGHISGRLIGSSVFKLEDMVVSFIHHKELRQHIRVNEF